MVKNGKRKRSVVDTQLAVDILSEELKAGQLRAKPQNVRQLVTTLYTKNSGLMSSTSENLLCSLKMKVCLSRTRSLTTLISTCQFTTRSGHVQQSKSA